MRHIPHLYLPDWAERPGLTPSDLQKRHMNNVLRISEGSEVSYTDGAGAIGSGVWLGDTVVRGVEKELPRFTDLAVAVAPPADKTRQRFVVEKLGELGVARLIWLRTLRGKNRSPSNARTEAWAVSALEQSRGAWLMTTSEALTDLADLHRPLSVCDPEGESDFEDPKTIAVGPEGGFERGEIPEDAARVSLGATVLRVETAAVVAAARAISV